MKEEKAPKSKKERGAEPGSEEEEEVHCGGADMMERPTAEAPSDVDKARQRVLSHYRHLFPGLRLEAEAGTPESLFEAVPTVALDPAFDLTPEAVGKGWTSQPQVRTCLPLSGSEPHHDCFFVHCSIPSFNLRPVGVRLRAGGGGRASSRAARHPLS